MRWSWWILGIWLAPLLIVLPIALAGLFVRFRKWWRNTLSMKENTRFPLAGSAPSEAQSLDHDAGELDDQTQQYPGE